MDVENERMFLLRCNELMMGNGDVGKCTGWSRKKKNKTKSRAGLKANFNQATCRELKYRVLNSWNLKIESGRWRDSAD